MKVLITNTSLDGYTGTELYVRDVAQTLQCWGHQPMVYSPRLGAPAEALRRSGIDVASDLAALTDTPDLIHGQHHLETMAALLHFPDVPGVFFCHGWLPWEETPPRFPRLVHYVAVSTTTRDLVVQHAGVRKEQVTVIRNFVDMDRFKPRAPLPDRPRRALVFSNHADGQTFFPIVRDACLERGIEVDVVGARAGRAVSDPENVLGDYDLVFARGKAALEAVAVGAAVVLCDIEGMGPFIHMGNLEKLRELNLGFKAMTGPVTLERVLQRIDAYDAAAAAAVSDFVRSSCSLPTALEQIVKVYKAALEQWKHERRDPGAEAEATSRYLAWVSRTAREQLDPEREHLRQVEAAMATERERLLAVSARQADDISRFSRSLPWRILQKVNRIPLVLPLYKLAFRAYRQLVGRPLERMKPAAKDLTSE